MYNMSELREFTHRSRAKRILESVLLAVIFMRPFRCAECDSRFFRWSTAKKPIQSKQPKTRLEFSTKNSVWSVSLSRQPQV